MQVLKLMQRMGKSIPEHKPAAAPAMGYGSGQTAASTASMPATKKVYCTPKINFVGQSLQMNNKKCTQREQTSANPEDPDFGLWTPGSEA